MVATRANVAASDLIAFLDHVEATAREKFEGAHHGVHRPRIDQLASALSTARMAVEHLYAEHANEADFRKRLTGDLYAQQFHAHQLHDEARREIVGNG